MNQKFTLLSKKRDTTLSRKVLITCMIVAVTGLVCWTVGFGKNTGVSFQATDVPQFTTQPHLNPALADAEKLVFVSHYLSRMLGSSDVSEFSKIADAWARIMTHDSKYMKYADYIISGEILSMMRVYESMKHRKKFNDPIANEFWGRITTVFQLNNGKQMFAEGIESKKSSGNQLKFWKTAQKTLHAFSSPQWVDKKGRLTRNHGAVVDKKVKYQKENYWVNSYYDEKADKHGNKLMTKNMVATQLLMDADRVFKFNKSKRILSDGAIGIDVPAIERSTAMALKYLEFFENAKLGHKMTSEDFMFARVIEKMIADWLTKNPNGFFTQHSQEVLGVKSKTKTDNLWKINEKTMKKYSNTISLAELNKLSSFKKFMKERDMVTPVETKVNKKHKAKLSRFFRSKRVFAEIKYAPIKQWKNVSKWLSSRKSQYSYHPEFKQFDKAVYNYQAKYNGCESLHCDIYWKSLAKNVWN